MNNPILSDRDCTCHQCRQPISRGARIQWKRVTVRSHRDGAGRVWDRPAYKAIHWDCTPFVAAQRRAEQLADVEGKIALMRDVAPAGVEFFEDMRLAILST